MFNSEIICAYANNHKWFAEALNIVRSDYNKYLGSAAELVRYNETYNNTLITWGNAGSGKTVSLAKMVAK
ncbi:MAG: hypothetical protein Nk1A_7920 [Endomicrobiia bacterium]|nr:MAG: hypothetical protein Nk1A_7920 [Endomicrobiia bacterium]